MANSEIRNILLKQAEHVKGKSEKLDAAKQLRQAADLLEAEAKKTEVPNFLKLARQEKVTRAEQFAANVAKQKQKELFADMHRNGWSPYLGNDKPNSFIQKGKPEIVCVVTGNKYSIFKHGEAVVKDVPSKVGSNFQFISPSEYLK